MSATLRWTCPIVVSAGITGFSSLTNLRQLPIDELKIDKSFVINLQNREADDIVIVRSTIELGHNMGLKVIAEGVENAEAWAILRDLGCDMAQGFYVSPPLPLQEFEDWFKRFAVGRALLYQTATELPTLQPRIPVEDRRPRLS